MFLIFGIKITAEIRDEDEKHCWPKENLRFQHKKNREQCSRQRDQKLAVHNVFF